MCLPRLSKAFPNAFLRGVLGRANARSPIVVQASRLLVKTQAGRLHHKCAIDNCVSLGVPGKGENSQEKMSCVLDMIRPISYEKSASKGLFRLVYRCPGLSFRGASATKNLASTHDLAGYAYPRAMPDSSSLSLL